jgi:hypothetical protein
LRKSKLCGVITIDAERLSTAHLTAAGASADTPVVGMPRNGALAELILAQPEPQSEDAPALQGRLLRQAIEQELLSAAQSLPTNTGAVVLECTNLPPYRRFLREQTGLPIYDIQTLIQWFWAGLRASEDALR